MSTDTQVMPPATEAGASVACEAARAFKTVFIIDRLLDDLGGTEGQITKLARGLSQRMQVELIVLQDSPWIRAEAQRVKHTVTVIDLKGGVLSVGFWRGVARLVRHLRASGPRVVHTFFPIANIIGTFAARLAGVPVVVGSRRDYGFWITPGYLRFTQLANRWVDRIVTNSPEVKRFTSAREGYPEANIEVIYNGLELDHLRLAQPDLALKAALGIPERDRVIALVANLRRIKRHDTLVEAFSLIRHEHDDVSLLFVGDPADPFHDELQRLIAARGLGHKVHYARAHGDIERYLSIMDIGCNCSESEGLSNAVMEYMAAGVPCVVSDGGGNKDLVRHEQNGLVFPVGDSLALASCLRRLLEDPAERQRYVQAGQVRLEAEMSMPVILQQFDRFYRCLN